MEALARIDRHRLGGQQLRVHHHRPSVPAGGVVEELLGDPRAVTCGSFVPAGTAQASGMATCSTATGPLAAPRTTRRAWWRDAC